MFLTDIKSKQVMKTTPSPFINGLKKSEQLHTGLLIFFIMASFSFVNGQKLKPEKKKIEYPGGLFNIGVGFGSPYLNKTVYEMKNEYPVNPFIVWEKPASNATVNPNESFKDFLKYIKTNITVGGCIGYNKSSLEYLDSTYEFNTFYIAARSSYHILHRKRWDPYLGFGLGFVYVITDTKNKRIIGGPVSGLGYSAFAGVRYKFARRFGLFLEAGYSSLSFVSTGITF